jgi:FAD/FMN-containing dehydrogenase
MGLNALQQAVGKDIVRAPGEIDLARHLKDLVQQAPAGIDLVGVAYPRTTRDVSDILRICNRENIKVTPQGGLTGLVGGGVPVERSLLLSMERMRRIEEIDAEAATMTVQAGAVLEAVQNAASEAGFFFPLDLGGRGSAQIGGVVSTNAGGNRVLRYGMMRDLVLGLEVVLADGTVVSSLNKMIKNNTGYDLKQLFIGSEGTLGVVTRAVLRLSPKPLSVCTALCAVEDYAAVLALLRQARQGFGGALSAFEAMWPEFYHIGTEGLGRQAPLAPGRGVYVLIELMGADPAADAARFEAVIGAALEAGLIKDAVIARSERETRSLWAIRECPGEFPKVFWPQLAFDISVPTGEIGDLKRDIETALRSRWPEIQLVFFGHVADANLHFSAKLDADPMPEHEIDEVTYAAVGARKGSISAEHGIGFSKRLFLHYSRGPEELELMRTLKRALDPNGILNPGKVI